MHTINKLLVDGVNATSLVILQPLVTYNLLLNSSIENSGFNSTATNFILLINFNLFIVVVAEFENTDESFIRGFVVSAQTSPKSNNNCC